MTIARRLILAAPAIAIGGSARAQPAGWTVATEYPATSIPGEGVTHFATAATARGVPTTAATDGPGGYRSAAALSALADGRFAAVDSFAGSMNAVDPLFLLSSLPFLTASHADAARLRDLARPHYLAALEKHGATLLWTTPWPPSGLWTRRPVTTPEDLRGLRVRTYDATGTEVLRAAGANAEVLSFAEVNARLEAGTLDAVLSSGDGGAGRQLWRWLPNFTELDYAWPLSLGFASNARLAELTPAQRQAVTQAGAETEARQWQAIVGRLEANRRVMRDNQVAIHDPEATLRAALRSAAGGAIGQWRSTAGSAAVAILTAYGV
ncbi:signal peptidase [Roseomonas terrae]|jgi:TRAP-type C4-dicarboxylate transport system substrate-binding protein|uniref:Signal peptidase n=1 Tax=Neoroseomonas terrae TaxID=424799 RepID=A0ABS5EH61_9PROT|nr:TRAP transporter substrate-binding protein DctP [Neoroseomonas terrae]MBR0650353.1 signal peptidase [Neoroseomonas terrae]